MVRTMELLLANRCRLAPYIWALDRSRGAQQGIQRPADAGQWHITEGTYRIALGKAADTFVFTAEALLTEQLFGS